MSYADDPRAMLRLWPVAVALLAAAMVLSLTGVARAATVQTFPIPTADSEPANIVAGPDGALYFTEGNGYKIGRITTAGQISEVPVPESQSDSSDMGPDHITSSGGDLWFTTDEGESIYAMTTAGQLSQDYTWDGHDAIGLGPADTGGVWLYDQLASGEQVQRIDPSGTATEYPTDDINQVFAPMTLAPNGSEWYGESTTDGDYLDNLTDAGAEVKVPTPAVNATYQLTSMAYSTTGALWYTEHEEFNYNFPVGGAIGELPAGSSSAATVWSTSDLNNVGPTSLTAGPGGVMYFSTIDGLGEITPSGQVNIASVAPYNPASVAYGPDGNLWFVDSTANVVGEVSPSALFGVATGTPTGPPTGPGPVKLSPLPRLRVHGATLRALRGRHGLAVRCSLASAGHCAVSAEISARSARRLGLKVRRHARSYRLASAGATLRKPGTVTLHLRPSRRVRDALRRARSLSVTLCRRVAHDRLRAALRAPAGHAAPLTQALAALAAERYRAPVFRTLVGYASRVATMGVAVALITAAPVLIGPAPAGAATVALFPVPTADAGLSQIVAGPDGNMWFTESNSANAPTVPFKVGSISVSTGHISEYPVPVGPDSTGDGEGPSVIVSSGENLWFLSDLGASLWKIAPGQGKPTEVGSYDVYDTGSSLATDDAGGVWEATDDYTNDGPSSLRHYTAGGDETTIPAQYGGEYEPVPIVSDGAGGVWYADNGDYLRHQPASGTSTSYPVNSPYSFYDVSSMAFDGHGNLYFTEYDPTAGFLPPGGAVGELAAGAGSAQVADFGNTSQLAPSAIALGPDGALWFATTSGVGRIDPTTGQVSLATIPDVSITDMAFGPDGNLWFVDAGANDIGRITTSTIFPPATSSPTPTPTPTPSPNPTPAPSPRPHAPVVRFTVSAQSLRVVARTRTLTVRCRLAGAGHCSVSATVTPVIARRLGLKVKRGATSVTLVRGSHTFRRAGVAELRLHLSMSLARRLSRRRALVVTVTVRSTAAGASPRSVHRRLTLRRS